MTDVRGRLLTFFGFVATLIPIVNARRVLQIAARSSGWRVDVNQEVAEFPRPIDFNGSIVFERSRVEFYKAQIVAAAVGGAAPEYVRPAIETFVNARELARELGFSRRTLGRKIQGMIKLAPPNSNTANSEAA